MSRRFLIVERTLAALVFLAGVVTTVGQAPANSGPAIPLTPEESAWLAEHPVLKVGADPQWPPFSFYGKDGRHEGVDADLLALLSQRLGVRFEVVKSAAWSETMTMARAGRLDLLCGTAETVERQTAFQFTEPYFGAPVAVIMRDDAPFYTGLRNLRGKDVAAPIGYVTTGMLQRQHPGIRLKKTSTAAEAMLAVSRGQADATVENLVTACYLLRAEGLSNLKIVGIADFNFQLRLAVPNDRPHLRSILDKGLASISEEERSHLRDKWVPVNIEGAINWAVVRRVALWCFLTAALIIAVVVFKNRRLARELAARRKAEQDLRVLHEEKDHLMAMLAHDLNNPLQTITLACDAIQEKRDDESIEIVRQTVDRMSRLVKNVLNVNALESGKSTLHLRRVDLSDVASDIVLAFQSRARAKRIALHFIPGEGWLTADADAMAQITDNLLGNALKFTPPGGKVTVEVAREDHSVGLRVSDTGPGIKPEEMPQLFEKFTRLSAQPTGGESSHGLGLAITKRLTEALGGTIAVESKAGEGATFRLRFPAV